MFYLLQHVTLFLFSEKMVKKNKLVDGRKNIHFWTYAHWKFSYEKTYNYILVSGTDFFTLLSYSSFNLRKILIFFNYLQIKIFYNVQEYFEKSVGLEFFLTLVHGLLNGNLNC